MSVLFGVSLMVLDEGAAEARDELPERLHFEPGLAANLLAMVDGEDDLVGDL